MRHAPFATLAALIALLTLATPTLSASPAFPATGLPSSIWFVQNVGQFPDEVGFVLLGAGHAAWVTRDALWLTLSDEHSGSSVRLTFPGCSSLARLEPFARVDTSVSYLTGSDPALWRQDVPVWGGARWRNLYPNLHLEITGSASGLAWRLSGPALSLLAFRLRVEGAERLALAGNHLSIDTAAGTLLLPLPEVAVDALWTIQGDELQLVTASPALRPPASAPLSSSTPSTLNYCTFLGAGGADEVRAIAVDSTGAAYLAGGTSSLDFPTTPGAFDRSFSGAAYEGALGDAFVAKLNPSGTALVYATFLGGSSFETAASIAVDSSGAAYIAGHTASPDFPTTAGAYDRLCGTSSSCNDSTDGFVAKLDPAGSALVYSTFVGGAAEDTIAALAVDAGGAVYAAGNTDSSDWPTTAGSFDRTFNGGIRDALA